MENVVRNVDRTFIYIIGVSLILLTFITGLMIYFLIRYRAERNPVASDIRGNWPLELAWTIIPLIIAMSMFYLGWQSFLGLRNVPPGALNIDVHAMQFVYLFKYPNNKESENLCVVPRGRPVKFTITSEDVLHGFYLPAFRIKMDAIKGMKTYTWLYADKLGEYSILCTQFCGIGHADMHAVLKIVPEPEYEKWLSDK